MTDYWSKEEGAIFDAYSYIIPCYASAAVTEGSCVTGYTSAPADGFIYVTMSSALGDGVGVAVRAALAAGDVIPVLFYGMFKFIVHWATVSTPVGFGSFVVNSITTTVVSTVCAGWNNASATCSAVLGGGSFILGMCVQKQAVSNDEALILVGKTA